MIKYKEEKIKYISELIIKATYIYGNDSEWIARYLLEHGVNINLTKRRKETILKKG